MWKKLSRNISGNILQQIINLLSGIAIFYILSRNMDKTSFGELNWCLAFLLTGFSVLSFGLDQLTVKKIAAGEDSFRVIPLFVFHTVSTGLLFCLSILAACILAPGNNWLITLFLLGTGKLMIYFSLPFKQAAAGFEKFTLLARMSVVSNIIKSVALIYFSSVHMLSNDLIIGIFIAGDFLEFLVSIYLFRQAFKHAGRKFINRQGYLSLLKETLPQIGVVVCTAVMSRFDWIFIGLVLSASKLAEYSFAYKVYEISTVPLLVIAPLLVPRFVKFFQKQNDLTSVYAIVKLEMIICSFVILMLNILWAPLTDAITVNKYGAVNSYTIFILTLCTPLLYVNNVLWAIAFAQGKLKSVFRVILITCCVNIVGDCILIPLFGNEGASIACLLALIAQTALYLKQDVHFVFSRIIQSLIGYPLCAIGCIYVAGYAGDYVVYKVLAGAGLYLVLVVATNRFIKKDVHSGLRMLVPDF
ncbi:oligosaccharide flippase family protein [Danxiaibacter flavus]|uniref:Oligosaccharide flippase family protein n=1 Tax=Danxiaibacter flavus TaxID=3049108 RepID=A0ABV3ZA27_9BACT|nr:oligosaccharide flippase family protein [Chitinophagaceae bacterium DXS]